MVLNKTKNVETKILHHKLSMAIMVILINVGLIFAFEKWAVKNLSLSDHGRTLFIALSVLITLVMMFIYFFHNNTWSFNFKSFKDDITRPTLTVITSLTVGALTSTVITIMTIANY